MTASAPITACLLVPNGRWDLAPLAAAIRSTSPTVDTITAVWAGDPHLRPRLAEELDIDWCDRALDGAEPGWNRLLVGMRETSYLWVRGAAAVARLLRDGAGKVVVLRVGAAAVLGDVARVESSAAITLIRRADAVLAQDDMAPNEDDLLRGGRHSDSVMAFGTGAQPALEWLVAHAVDMAADDSITIGSWLDRMGEAFGARSVGSDVATIVGWTTSPDGARPAVVDLAAIDRAEPWHVSIGARPARTRLSADQSLAAMVAESWPQCVGEPSALVLPGGIPVAGPVRRLVAASLRGRDGGSPAGCPEPYGARQSEFTAWLESSEPHQADVGRYWLELRAERADLQAGFPQPNGADAARFREWADAAWRLEPRTALLAGSRAAPRPAVAADRAATPPADTGVNVIGYLDFDQSQGHIARELIAALRAAGVSVAPISHKRSQGSRRPEPFGGDNSAPFATTIVVVNADQFGFVVADFGDTALRDRHTIGYWFWELEDVPPPMVAAIEHVDEIWTGSEFVAEAFRRVTDKPVHCVPLPVEAPQPSARDRASFGVPDDRFVFLTTFDQFSVPERKNPFGVIDAFRRAFADGEGPLLWIKSMNGHRAWRHHERLLLAAAGRSDILVTDEHLSRADQMAVLHVADCLVSLHRSEGLGLHCAEAMWLSKPVIATRYSGNLDFMDDSCSALVDYALTPVRHGDGIYPESACWADPDLDQAARWMRRLVEEPGVARAIGEAARAKMEAQMSLAAAGRVIAGRVGAAVARPDLPRPGS